MRYILVGYTAKNGGREFTCVKGYAVDGRDSIPSFTEIRSDCLKWANRDGDDFNFLQINFIQFVGEEDYKSFMEIN